MERIDRYWLQRDEGGWLLSDLAHMVLAAEKSQGRSPAGWRPWHAGNVAQPKSRGTREAGDAPRDTPERRSWSLKISKPGVLMSKGRSQQEKPNSPCGSILAMS